VKDTLLRRALDRFPIPGKAVCQVLASFPLEQRWVLLDIETLTSINSAQLGSLWQEVKRRPVSINNQELINSMQHADQIINLKLRMADNHDQQLVIEDGNLITCTLDPSATSR